MEKRIVLTDQEQRLRRFLVDVSNYVGTQNGHQTPILRFTGGWVRDKLLGTSSKDIDIGIDTLTGLQFSMLMKQFLEQPHGYDDLGTDILGKLATIKGNPEKSKHLETVTTKIYGFDVDLVNLRQEKYSETSRNPEMEFGTPEQDALRRDATVNALFYNIMNDDVEDLTGQGLRDLNHKVIRTPLPPYQTFKDDPLRVLRSIRFASRLGYSIDSAAESAMSDREILEQLRVKISRERVGIEIEKMLKGPHPRDALALIDRLGLYDTIFTDPTQDTVMSHNIQTWHRAYDQLSKILDEPNSSQISSLRSILLESDLAVHLAWLLCAILPWLHTPKPIASTSKVKKWPVSAAATVMREGLKADNDIVHIIDDAFRDLDEIIGVKQAWVNEPCANYAPAKRKHEDVRTRGELGLAIRRWGQRKNSHWQSSVVCAMLFEIMENDTEEGRQKIVDDYSAWVSTMQELDLLDAHHLKPIVDGNRLRQAVGRDAGPWLGEATLMVIKWQLKNPKEKDPTEIIADVVSRYKTRQ